jgi:halimadienyl-diphosphate synthase
MSDVAYDAAWVARIGDIDREISSRAAEWLCEHQLADGSWGAQVPFYHHDRLISTLAAMIALARNGQSGRSRRHIERGLSALERLTDWDTLPLHPNGATVGFEMITPTLVSEAQDLGLLRQRADRILGRMAQLRAIKMNKLDGKRINRHLTPAFSSEMAGRDYAGVLDTDDLQEKNGSIANSPSATAYFVSSLMPGDSAALAYLGQWVSTDGGTPNVAPFDIFEPAWVIWNLSLAGYLNGRNKELYTPHLDFIHATWVPGVGIGHASEYTPKDGDDTGFVFGLLSQFDRDVDIEAVLSYEEDRYFRCFALEANPSVSANIHILGGLRQAGYPMDFPAIQKILGFLRRTRVAGSYWLDKWHLSPYYPTAHAIIACAGFDDEICLGAVDWIVRNQAPDGSWGYFGAPTAEETAYCLQALAVWARAGRETPRLTLDRGRRWLIENMSHPYPPQWIGKGLYCPVYVVESAILSALRLTEEMLQ